ncbi:hypothetical protein [Actinokineospora terrae]|uniref:Uncharacterized protein n=1 Tax=Actinokineospora terrae TaxID=155974 RepID=A0A1H9M7P3_9PSEU|nr:hypothetical protein [Actinokineospora terrae]SER19714.1 hypothetical protein SAMN04487818_1026 [Actinokineospora terrae]
MPRSSRVAGLWGIEMVPHHHAVMGHRLTVTTAALARRVDPGDPRTRDELDACRPRSTLV